ncbi:MAG: Omp28-related outer membrane protein, partial [Muribaculaceae bacterium]|nr:Omp28-related outer membrane protein [Muribaculaceae bacterium]
NMKNFLHYAIISSLSLPAFGWNVGTDPTNKSVVIEEFTGIHCSNCPDGHKRATMLHHSRPEDLFIVSVHSGYFATPSPREPNYITKEGQEIHDYFEVNSYPCGTTSRRDAGHGIVQGRSDWGASARVIASETSPVNLWMGCSYDSETRKLNVTVEGYYTEKMTDPRLTVEILQDNILGPQSGGLMGVEYPHRHMLRAMLNDDAFGEKLSFSGIDTYFTKTYSTVLPEDIDGVPLVDSDLQLLAFVAEGQGEIVKAVKCYPDIDPKDAKSNIFVQSEPLIPIGKNYGLGYVEVYVDNYSYQDLTEATFEVKLNGGNDVMKWEGLIPPHSEGLVKVPLPAGWETIHDNDDNSLSIKMLTANGEPTALETLPIKSNFSKISELPADLTVKITTDIEAADNTFRIIDTDGNIVAEFGPYPDGEISTNEENVKLDSGKVYGFEAYDIWGNGIYHPRGSVKFYGPDGNICAQLMEIGNFGTRLFFRTSGESGVSNPEFEEETIEYY